tara:strand:- start:129 stop:644 length:516 start_codon:yes stop_codon:yes gene_type:complete
MRTIRTFKKWLELGEPEVLVKSKIYIEDLSGGEKTKKIVLLKQLLKDFDFFYHYSDDRRAYQRGKEQQDTIEKLVKEIGKDGLKIYRKYISTKESKETTGTGKYMTNLIPEMRNVKPHDNTIPLGESGTSHLSDGNLFSGFQFFPRTPKLKSFAEKSMDRTSIYGKVYRGD